MTSEWPYLAPSGDLRSPPQPITVGVLLTAHNVAPHLPAALHSVFTQTRLPDQVVVCDDASSDDVKGAVHNFGDRVRLVRHPVQRGEGAAKNTAVAALDTDLVVVLDGDDEMAPQRLEALAWLAERRPDLHLLTTTWEDFGPGVEPTDWTLADHFPTVDQRAEMLRWNFVPAPAIRRVPLLEAGGFDETLRYGPDWECYVRMFLRGASAGLVPLPLYRYRRWTGQQTADRERVLAGRVRVGELIAANRSLTPADRRVADRSLQELRHDYWAWRLARGAATRSESLALLRGGRWSARRTAMLTLATMAPHVARRLRER
ncbi:glycosyltransferase family 2 protein [Modestobacter excelsi]|uniref:glycosyltransferase family 2 protein n=1 Tax=Modestobacter excelsi TaxID=2213161 RepID=UPI00110D01F9|nr:glycosyltransferase family A protein [Modestobacter excelsi]